MTRYEFLSEAWIAEAERIHLEFADRLEPPPYDVRVNIVVDSVPNRVEPLVGHIDTSSGRVSPQFGLLDDPELTIYLDYATAYGLFVANDIDETVTAFMQGRIEVDGDVSRLFLLQELEPSPEQLALGELISQRVMAITEPA